MTAVYVFDGTSLRAATAPANRPLRWAAWRPDGAYAILAGNRGEALRYDGKAFQPLPTDSTHNLRGVDWSPDGGEALLVGNRGAVLRYDGARCEELAPVTTENLRRVAWSPDGTCALVIGNGGVVLRYERSNRALLPLAGDRAHTMRAIAWRPDGAYALIGAYASAFAGYPRPHMLYRCDGRYTQALLATDDEDDAVAIAWQPGAMPHRALVLAVAYGDGGAVANKLIAYDGSGFTTTSVEAPGALLGAAWSTDGSYALLCGESGALLRSIDGRIEALPSRTNDNLVGPFWRPSSDPLALLLKGPDEKIYTA